MPKISREHYSLEQNFLKSDHLVAFTDTAEDAYATEVDGVRIVQAGTVIPANDGTAVGLAMHDTEVGQPLSVMVEGHVYTDHLPVEPTAEAQAAMKNIGFH